MRHNNFYASWFLVQDNHNEWPMRICPATIRSYCILHSLKSFAETNSAKTAKKKKLQVTLKQRTWHGRLRPRYIVSGVISEKNSPKIHHFFPLHPRTCDWHEWSRARGFTLPQEVSLHTGSSLTWAAPSSPFIYGALSEQLRRGFKGILRCFSLLQLFCKINDGESPVGLGSTLYILLSTTDPPSHSPENYVTPQKSTNFLPPHPDTCDDMNEAARVKLTLQREVFLTYGFFAYLSSTINPLHL